MEDRRKQTRRQRRIFNKKASEHQTNQPAEQLLKTQASTPPETPLTGSWATPPSYTSNTPTNVPKASKQPNAQIGKKSSAEKSDDIGLIWAEQARIRDEEEALLREYEQTKAKTKELKQKLKQTDREGDKLNLKGVLTPELYETVAKNTDKTKAVLKKTKHSVVRKTKHSFVPKAAQAVRKVRAKTPNRKLVLSVVSVAALSVGIWSVYSLFMGDGKPTGDSATQVEGISDEKPTFEILYPSGKDSSAFRTGRVSPSGSEPAYAYTDTLDGTALQVTQQQLPDAFRDDPAAELRKVATDFQATSVIQIDDTTVYHGVNEKQGIQSLIFQKNGLLVLIRAEKQIPDDQWVGYIAGLK